MSDSGEQIPDVVVDVTGKLWNVVDESNGATVSFRVNAVEGSESFISEADPRRIHPAALWDVADPREAIAKIEAIVDDADAANASKVIQGIFNHQERPVPEQYLRALNSHGTYGWTPLYRAVLLGRESDTVRALIEAGADPGRTQGPDAFPFQNWTPVAVALERRDAQRLVDLFSRKKMDEDLVVGVLAAARIVDEHRASVHTDPMQQAIIQSAAASTRIRYTAKLAPNPEAVKYAARFLRISPADFSELYSSKQTVGFAPLGAESPLIRYLIQRDLPSFRKQLAVSEPSEIRAQCDHFLKQVLDVPGGAKLWTGFRETLRQAQKLASREHPRGGGRVR
ncbi:hypothetical protein [Longimicrobium terrae]|uniref:Ankyrin repeat domain-containing protein n=1 Tax=Longimicrobium terrae TaxID=1639882 RepID=A0A841GWI6_9BACT|nr:hypothetical protein [Longimicrobium terrae]MBB4635659.1 hypothetical protein [Longimicrobium terrae]MBB6070053.1 hypothetical protein [Longimicrobium terrae]NNC32959.1 hypothetical protein [Longimicrobium terrae]